MEPIYFDEENFQQRVEHSRTFLRRKSRIRNKFDKSANCVGNALYLIGFASKETFFPTDLKEITDFFVECDEKEATFVSLEELSRFSRRILHIATIDPLNRNILYGRLGPAGVFMEANRDWSEEGLIEGVGYWDDATPKYCKLNLRSISVYLQELRAERRRNL